MSPRRVIAVFLLAAFAAALPVSAQALAVGALKPPGGTESLLQRPARLHVTDLLLESALDRLARTSGATVAFSPSLLESENWRVSCDCRHVTVAEALDQLLEGTRFGFRALNGQVVLVPRLAAPPPPLVPDVAEDVRFAGVWTSGSEGWAPQIFVPQSDIEGIVVEAGSGRPIVGAQVMVEGTQRGALTDEKGRFRITGVSGPRVVLRVQAIGYRTKTQEAAVGAAAVRIEMDITAIALDQIVVTGFMTETELRKVDAPVTIITARELETSPIQKVDEIFRGAVPGASSWETGPDDYYSYVTLRGANSLMANYTKVYIDGVAIANPAYLSTIDKSSVARVEVSRGPGATTLYGSDAGGGVIQIFTKKGRPEPQLTVSLAAGPTESKWVDDRPWQRELQVGYTGGESGFTYNLGGTYRKEDPYVPENDDELTMLHGGARIGGVVFSTEVTARYSSRDFGNPLNPVLRDAGYAYWSVPMNHRFQHTQQTLGTALRYQPTAWWNHSLVLGFDQNETANFATKVRRTSPADTLLYNNSGYSQVQSARYTTTLDYPTSGAFQSTLTLGAEYSKLRSNGYIAYTTFARGSGSAPANLFRDDWSTRGVFAQWQPALFDRLFITAGVRVEDNEFFGADYGADVSPRIGATTNFRIGGVTVKPRVSYGRGIHAPTRYYRDGTVQTWAIILPNPKIGPESQEGWDAGFDVLLLGNAGRLEVTRYDQTARDLIQYVQLGTNDQGVQLSQYQNTGEIANTGWEFAAQYVGRRLGLSGSLAFRTSRVQKLNEGYTGQLQVGDDMLEIASPVGGASATYRFGQLSRGSRGGSVSLEMSHTGEWTALDYQALYGYYYAGDPYRGSQRAYWTSYKPVTKLNLSAAYDLSPAIQPYVQIRNLTNSYRWEKNNITTTFGRSVLLGVRYTR